MRPASAQRGKYLLRYLLLSVVMVAILLPLSVILLYSVVVPPLTPLMVIRSWEGTGLHKQWAPLDDIAPAAAHAIIAAEDNRFCRHMGIDWQAVLQAIDDYWAGERLRGASTISMQVAKNLFLWPQRSPLRKVLEAYLTVLIETLWSKRRILEVYLNVAEWGPGIYGIETAAQRYFGKSAATLDRHEASLLAAILPNPRGWSIDSGYVLYRAQTIRGRMQQIRSFYDCL
jgi:monofunctional biosynthetic peptidoglycan transglycosylase